MSNALKTRIKELKTQLLSVQPQLTELARCEQTLANNEAFEKLSPAKKRVSIAQDVLAQIKAKKYFAKQETYVNIVGDKQLDDAESHTFEFYDQAYARDAQIALVNDELSCNVCALGALITSTVKIDDKCSIRELTQIRRGRVAHGRLLKYFGHKQLGLIETAFERDSTFAVEWRCSKPSIKAALDFGKKRVNTTARLKAIMQNIVDNNGQFVPTK